MASPEPVTVYREKNFEMAVWMELDDIRNSGVACSVSAGSRFDLTVQLSGLKPRTLHIEVKAYGGQRPGGIGFGNQNGEGPQVDLLIDANEIANRGQDIRWAFADGTREVGSKRYALLTSSQACEAAMGRVGRSKQNNFRLSALRDQWVTWTEFCEKLKLFVIGI